MIAGLGFTVALFVTDPPLADQSKIGILVASVIAAAAAAFVLGRTSPRRPRATPGSPGRREEIAGSLRSWLIQLRRNAAPTAADSSTKAASGEGPKIILRWILEVPQVGSVVVNESVFLPGKLLELESRDDTPPPKTLEVYQVYSSAMRQILRHIGVPDRRATGTIFKAVSRSKHRYRSDTPWALASPRGFRKSAAFVFQGETSASASPPVFSSRIAKADFSVTGGIRITDPTGLTPIGANGQASWKTQIHFTRDPELQARIITGEDLAEHLLDILMNDFGQHDADEGNVAARIEPDLDNLRLALRAAYTPPQDWAANLTETVVEGEAGETVETTLDLAASSAGTGYFAVTYYAADDPDLGETTDAWLVDVDERGRVSVTIDPSETALREPLPS